MHLTDNYSWSAELRFNALHAFCTKYVILKTFIPANLTTGTEKYDVSSVAVES